MPGSPRMKNTKEINLLEKNWIGKCLQIISLSLVVKWNLLQICKALIQMQVLWWMNPLLLIIPMTSIRWVEHHSLMIWVLLVDINLKTQTSWCKIHSKCNKTWCNHQIKCNKIKWWTKFLLISFKEHLQVH